MKSPIKIITLLGTEITLEQWQLRYGLKAGSSQIGKYFDATESKFAEDIQRYKQLVVNEPLMRLMDHFRETLNKPVSVNSYNRDEKKQAELSSKGFESAKYSPHVVKMAVDIDTTSPDQSRSWGMIMKRCAIELGIKARVGVELYIKKKQTFIHVDVCPEYYAPGKPFNKNFHPVQWEKVITW